MSPWVLKRRPSAGMADVSEAPSAIMALIASQVLGPPTVYTHLHKSCSLVADTAREFAFDLRLIDCVQFAVMLAFKTAI